ncbi:hypothetical protein GA0074695_3174 [Micromonospora viridifaciens]|uniref:Uncharacterized protein n=2 Tax=Micromonospora viridifaciens TaxID=1881 RepID=A0A1C4XBJ0_MICVI|nr:hypothetical protein GA0074695_3174 [Micromonospora viridifaciens]
MVVILLAAGCGKGDLGGDATADDRYGYGPKPDKSVVYQPDVVLVAGGSRAIRSVSRDGFTYVIDGNARGVKDVAPGKIMFATSEAVGRVVKVERSGGDKAVTLAPVRLTDVVRDGHFKFDQPLDLEAQTFSPLPDLLGEVVDGAPAGGPVVPDAAQVTGLGVNAIGAGDLRLAVPPIVLAPAREPGARRAKSIAQKVGDWDVVAYKDRSKLGLTASHGTAVKRLKVDFDIQLLLRNLRAWGDIRVTNGVIPNPQFRIDGVEGLAITIAAGAEGGLEDNKKAKIELPIEVKQPIIIGGFPATLTETFKFLVTTGFSAKNGNIKATGKWGLNGPIGYVQSTVLTPTFSVQDSIVESIRGVSIGVEGLVVAAEFRFGFMLGLPVAGAGPFVGIVASVGVTNGSAAGRIGMPLPVGPGVKCRGSTLVLTVRAGEGISVSAPLTKAIEHVLGVSIPKEADFIKKDIVNRTVVQPDVPLCRD